MRYYQSSSYRLVRICLAFLCFRVSYMFNQEVSWSLGIIDRINSNSPNEKGSLWLESALTLVPSDKVKLTLYGLVGPGVGAVDVNWGGLLLGGGFISVQATEQTSAVVESYYANQISSSTISSGKNARWNGVAAYLIHDFSTDRGIHLRSEIFEGAGGSVACQGTTDYQPMANVCFGATSSAPAPALAQTLWKVTPTLQYKPVNSLTTRLEYRYDKSNQNVFQVGGGPTSYQPTLSFEAICAF